MYNDPGRLNTDPEKRMAVTAAQVQEAVKAHLGNNNRVVIHTVPTKHAAGPPATPASTPQAQ